VGACRCRVTASAAGWRHGHSRGEAGGW
jgi:hypothetical protein